MSTDAAHTFLAFLFADLHSPAAPETTPLLELTAQDTHYLLTDQSRTLYSGRLDVQFAAVLFDQVIYHLLHTQHNGVALHAGAVSWQGQTILLPGRSGSGKSSVTAWLTSQGCSYLSDELVFLPNDGAGVVIPFPRPFCLKPGSAAVVKALLPAAQQVGLLADEHGAVIPHRLFNPTCTLASTPPGVLLFPVYQSGAVLHVEQLSQARASALLMSCDVNARNLPDHGFHQITQLARSIPAWQITYSSFAGLPEVWSDLAASFTSP